jgi:hypothetical protein
MKNKLYKIRSTDYYGEFLEAVLIGDKRTFPDKPETLPLKSGQKLLIKWPNGKVTTETIEVHQYPSSAQVDMNGYPDNFTAQSINAVRSYQGQKIRLPLKGLQVRPSRKP